MTAAVTADGPPSPLVSVELSIRPPESFAADDRALQLGAPSVRVAVLSEAAVSYGVGVRDPAPYLLRSRDAGLPTIRRSSGGTGVLHAAGDLVWSVVLPRSDPRVGRDFVRAYGRLGAGVVRFLAGRRVRSGWVAPLGLSVDYCVLSGRGEVLAVDSRILGGAAQHVSRTALLHQGMVPLQVDRPLVRRLFAIHDPQAIDRLVGLRDLGLHDPPEELAPELAASIAGSLAPPG